MRDRDTRDRARSPESFEKTLPTDVASPARGPEPASASNAAGEPGLFKGEPDDLVATDTSRTCVESKIPSPSRGRRILATLEGLARAASVPVRYVNFQGDKRAELRTEKVGRGGVCRLAGKLLILCEKSLPPIDKAFVLAEALAQIGVPPGVSTLNLPPFVERRLYPARSGFSRESGPSEFASGDSGVGPPSTRRRREP